MDPPQAANPLNPWGISKKKKTKAQGIAGFFVKKTDAEVRKEQDDADARALAATADAETRRMQVRHKLNLLVEKWNLPPRPSLIRKPGESGRTKLADKWIVGLYLLAQKVAAGDIREPSSVIVPPADPKKAAHIDSWKPYRVPTVGFTPEKVAEFYQTQQSGQTAIELAEELDGASAEAEGSDGDDAEGADTAGTKKDKQPWYKEWQWRTFVNLQRSMPGA